MASNLKNYITYSEFVKASKWVTGYEKKTKTEKLLFNIVLPLKFIKFRIIMKRKEK